MVNDKQQSIYQSFKRMVCGSFNAVAEVAEGCEKQAMRFNELSAASLAEDRVVAAKRLAAIKKLPVQLEQ